MSKRCVLVIDDESDIREIAQMSLQITKDWSVLTAASGHEGVAIASKEQPDAILLDLIMPEVDGLATLQLLNDTLATQNIPVVLLTATAKAATMHQYAQMKVKAILVKPFDPGTFGDQIEAALGW